MKTIQQLLELSKNPHYKMSKAEKEVLDAFLSQKQDTTSKDSQKKNLEESSQKTRAIVRNIVKKARTYPPEADESSPDGY